MANDCNSDFREFSYCAHAFRITYTLRLTTTINMYVRMYVCGCIYIYVQRLWRHKMQSLRLRLLLQENRRQVKFATYNKTARANHCWYAYMYLYVHITMCRQAARAHCVWYAYIYSYTSYNVYILQCIHVFISYKGGTCTLCLVEICTSDGTLVVLIGVVVRLISKNKCICKFCICNI